MDANLDGTCLMRQMGSALVKHVLVRLLPCYNPTYDTNKQTVKNKNINMDLDKSRGWHVPPPEPEGACDIGSRSPPLTNFPPTIRAYYAKQVSRTCHSLHFGCYWASSSEPRRVISKGVARILKSVLSGEWRMVRTGAVATQTWGLTGSAAQ